MKRYFDFLPCIIFTLVIIVTNTATATKTVS